MKILAPYISCALEASDFVNNPGDPLEQVIGEGYTQIYIPTAEGYYKYHVLQPGENGKRRFVCLKAKDTPGLAFPKVTEGVQFLPAGKIPMQLLNTVKEFFKQVILKKGRALEAMIWILWNEIDGYHLHVPNQRVSHGSASYDWNSLPAGSNIIVDIHSHADFNAFFSGTDNADDSNSIRFSGVIGHNDKPVRSTEFRFNYLGYRVKVEIDDLFYTEEQVPDIEESWFDKVQTSGPAGHRPGGTGAVFPTAPYRPGPGAGGATGEDSELYANWLYGKNTQARSRGMSGIHGALQEVPGISETGGADPKKLTKKERRALKISEHRTQERGGRRGQQAQLSLVTESSESQSAEGNGGPDSGGTFFDNGSGGLVPVGEGALEGPSLVKETLDELSRLCRLHGNNNGLNIWRSRMASAISIATGSARETLELLLEGVEEFSQYFSGEAFLREVHISFLENEEGGLYQGMRGDMAELSGRGMISDAQEEELDRQAEEHFRHAMSKADLEDGSFDEIAINNGVEAARAYSAIERASVELTKAPELLVRQVLDMFSMVEEDRKLETFRRMVESLSTKDRDRLAANGL